MHPLFILGTIFCILFYWSRYKAAKANNARIEAEWRRYQQGVEAELQRQQDEAACLRAAPEDAELTRLCREHEIDCMIDECLDDVFAKYEAHPTSGSCAKTPPVVQ